MDAQGFRLGLAMGCYLLEALCDQGYTKNSSRESFSVLFYVSLGAQGHISLKEILHPYFLLWFLLISISFLFCCSLLIELEKGHCWPDVG